MSQSEKTLSWIVKGGLLLVLLLPFLVTRSMYFPFITGKNFAFRILIEILAVFWVWLMLTSPRFRPKLSFLTVAYSAFIGVLILANGELGIYSSHQIKHNGYHNKESCAADSKRLNTRR